MIKQHANKHLDKIKFPTNQGQDYILERGKYTKMAYGMLQNNWQNAEDAVQETYRTLLDYPACATFESLEDFEGYFTVVLRGVVSRMFRNEKAQEKHSVTPKGKYLQYLEVETHDDDQEKREEVVALADEETNPESAYLAGEMLDKIKKEIQKLSFNSRNVVALSVLYGYKPYEIVEITGLKREKVYSDIKLFRNLMKEKLN